MQGRDKFEQIKSRLLHKSATRFDLFYWADMFMREYGMSFNDFKKLNIQAFYMLKDRMNTFHEEQNKKMKIKGKK